MTQMQSITESQEGVCRLAVNREPGDQYKGQQGDVGGDQRGLEVRESVDHECLSGQPLLHVLRASNTSEDSGRTEYVYLLQQLLVAGRASASAQV